MKRHKPKPPVKIDISDDFLPTNEGFKKLDVKELKNYKNEVDEILMNGVLERVDGPDRPQVMRLVYKALKPGGKAMFQFSEANTPAAIMSPFHKYPPLTPQHMGFFSKEVRDRSNYTNPSLNDIDFELVFAAMTDEQYKTKPPEFKAFAEKHYVNYTMGYAVTMTKKGK